MNDFLDFLAFSVGVAYLLWAVAAASRSVDRHYDRQTLARLAAQETDLQARIVAANRVNQRLKEGR